MTQSLRSSSSSRASLRMRARVPLLTSSFFPLVKVTLTTYPQWLSLMAMGIELLQFVTFSLNPHMRGAHVAWSILYFAQLPFWDGMYATGVTYETFLPMYWVFNLLALGMLALVALGFAMPHSVSSVAVSSGLRHAINLLTTVAFVPAVQSLLAALSCVPDSGAATALAARAGESWLFAGQSCSATVHVAHTVVSAVLLALVVPLALVFGACLFQTDPGAPSPKRRAHGYLDVLSLALRAGICVAFHTLVPRGMASYYLLIVAMSCLVLSVAYAVVLPFLARPVNRLYSVGYAVASWCAWTVFIAERLGNGDALLSSGGFYAILTLGAAAAAVAAYVASGYRYSQRTLWLLRKALEPGFVPAEQNPFAHAARRADPEALPFPARLPASDFAFSPFRFVESEVVEEALRNEEMHRQQMRVAGLSTSFGAGGGAGPAAGPGASSSANPAAPADTTVAGMMLRCANRVQVVAPMIEVAWLPTDAEVASRFVNEWNLATAAAPTPHMLGFGCRIFARFLLKFPASPTATIAFVRFMVIFTPSLSRMNLAVQILEALPSLMACDVSHNFQIFASTLSVKEVLGVRDRSHELMYRRARRLHRETLIQTASVWRSLLEAEQNLVLLCHFTNGLSELRDECTRVYQQAMSVASDDEMLFRSFATFVEGVMRNRACNQLVLEEADAISFRRRARLLQGAADVEASLAAAAKSGAAGDDARSTAGKSGAAASQLSSSLGGSSTSRMFRSEDAARYVLRVIFEALEAQTHELRQNLSANVLVYSTGVLFAALLAVAALNAAVPLALMLGRDEQVLRIGAAVWLRGASHMMLSGMYQAASLIGATDGSFEEALAELRAQATSYQEFATYLTASPHAKAAGSFAAFIGLPATFYRVFVPNAASEIVQVDLLSATQRYGGGVLNAIALLQNSATTAASFFADADVRTVLRFGPITMSGVLQRTHELIMAEVARTTNDGVIIIACVMCVALLVLAAVAYGFIWNFRRAASQKVTVLKLFASIPRDSVRRLATESKERVERFLAGNVANADADMEALGTSGNGATLDGDDAGAALGGGGGGGASDANAGALQALLGDEDGRRSSYSSKLLAHLLQKGTAVEVAGSGASATAAAAATAAASASAAAAAASAAAAAGGKKPPPSDDGGGSTAGDAPPPARMTPAGAAGASYPLTTFDATALDAAAAAAQQQHGRAGGGGGGGRRISVSLGTAFKNQSLKRTRSIIEMTVEDAGSAEDNTANPEVEEDEEGAEDGAAAAARALTSPSAAGAQPGARGSTALLVVVFLLTLAFVTVGMAMAGLGLTRETTHKSNIDDATVELEASKSFRAAIQTAIFKGSLVVSAGDYEDYQAFAAAYTALQRSTDLDLPRLQSARFTDWASTFYSFTRVLELSAVGGGLISSVAFTPNVTARFNGAAWAPLARDQRTMQRYAALGVPNVASTWTQYSTSAADLAKNATERLRLARYAFFDSFAWADFDAAMTGLAGFVAAAIDRIDGIVRGTEATLKEDIAVSLASWAMVSLLTAAFLYLRWHASGKAVRRTGVLLILVSLATVPAAGVALSRLTQRASTTASVYVQSAVAADTGDHLTRIINTALAYSALGADNAGNGPLSRYFGLTSQDAIAANMLGPLLPPHYTTLSVSDTVAVFAMRLADLCQYLSVALTLTASTASTVPVLPTLADRLSFIRWDIEQEARAPLLNARYPSDAVYTNRTFDMARPTAERAQLARSVAAAKRVTQLANEAFEAYRSAFSQLDTERNKAVTSVEDAWNSALFAFFALSCVSTGAFVLFLLTLGSELIASFSTTLQETAVYDSLYARYSWRVILGIAGIALVVVVTSITAIMLMLSSLDYQETYAKTRMRSFTLAQLHSNAEAVFSSIGRSHDEINARMRLRRALTDAVDVFSEATLGMPASERAREGPRNVDLFGVTDAGEAELRDVVSTTAGTLRCYNPATGNQAPVAIALLSYFDLMKRFAFNDTTNDGATYVAANNSAAALILKARGLRGSLISKLRSNGMILQAKVVDDIAAQNTGMVILLIVSIIACIVAFVLVFQPIAAEVLQHDAGARLLLTALPDDVRGTVPEIAEYFESDEDARNDQLKKKLQQSEKLLQNILPPVISRRLKNGERVIADTHPSVTVVFAALIGFDEYSKTMEARQIVHFLNSLIVTFDHIVDLLELEKIKTIGDVYFLCGGLTKKTEQDHPLRCMECAIFFLEALAEHNVRHNTPNLTLRVGINTDPAVAGVIGSKKVAYDLWGDSVNTASRMQSTGVPGRIQVSAKTFQLVRHYFAFQEHRVSAKGKGELTTHLYLNRLRNTPYRNLNWKSGR